MLHIGKRQHYEALERAGFSEKQISIMSLDRLASTLGISKNKARRLQSHILGKLKMFGPINSFQTPKKYRIYYEPDREPVDFLAASMFFGAPKP